MTKPRRTIDDPAEAAPARTSTRRDFMQLFGTTMLGLLGARHLLGCSRSSQSGGGAAPVTPDGAAAGEATTAAAAGAPTGGAAGETVAASGDEAAGPAAWARLRRCWYEIEKLETAARGEDDGHGALDAAKSEHRAALDDLVAAGEVGGTVAEPMQVGFEEAAFHVWRSSVGRTCYRPTILGGSLMDVRGRVLAQAQALEEVASSGEIADDVIASAREELQRQLAVFDAAAALERLEGDERWEAERLLVERIEAGEVVASAEESEAARLLVRALLGRSE